MFFGKPNRNVKRVTSELLSLTTGCNPVTIRSILSALKKENILIVKSGTGGAKVNCPLEDINLGFTAK